VAIFSRKDPRKLLYRSDAPIFSPEKDWEKIGQVPNVVFVEGLVRAQEKIDLSRTRNYFRFYYGAADKYIGVAQADVSPSLGTP
jgi:predicted GH43/DUF377 family glycosyl hydrolase